MSAVTFPELIRRRINGNKTYAATMTAIIILTTTDDVFSFVCITVPPPSY